MCRRELRFERRKIALVGFGDAGRGGPHRTRGRGTVRDRIDAALEHRAPESVTRQRLGAAGIEDEERRQRKERRSGIAARLVDLSEQQLHTRVQRLERCSLLQREARVVRPIQALAVGDRHVVVEL